MAPPDDSDEGVGITKVLCREGGIVVCQGLDSYSGEFGAYDRPEKIE